MAQWTEAEIQERVNLKKWCKKVGADLGQLDILVEDAKCQEASSINSRGLWAQIHFLLKCYEPEGLRSLILHELKILKDHALASQHKSLLGPSISTNPKKKKRRKDA